MQRLLGEKCMQKDLESSIYYNTFSTLYILPGENRRTKNNSAVSSLHALHAFPSAASLCFGACVELESDTEVVANQGFKLGCISCKMRGEVRATASVNWYFRATDDEEFSHVS